MTRLVWTGKALSDLARLHDFLAAVNPTAAAKAVRALTGAGSRLVDHPRIGEKLTEFEPREVRRIIVGTYELRYEISDATLHVLRVWHTRENR